MAATSPQSDVSGRQILTSDGRCLDVNNISTGDIKGNNVVVLLNTCDAEPNISDGQKWSIVTSGPHVLTAGFAIVTNTKTGKCVDMNIGTNLGYATMYECGGRVEGDGTESIWQAVGYTKGSADAGKQLTFDLLGGLKNNGAGPGNICWASNTTALGWSNCDPLNPTSVQKFTVRAAGSSTTPPPSTTTGLSTTPIPQFSGTTSPSDTASSSSSSTPTGAIAGGVVGGIVLLGIIAVLFFIYRRRQRRANADSQPSSRKLSDKTKVEPFVVAGHTEGGSSSSQSKPISTRSEMSAPIVAGGQDLPSLLNRQGVTTTGATQGPRTATSINTDLSSPIPASVISSNVSPSTSVPRTAEDKTAAGIRRPVDLTTPSSSSGALHTGSTLSYPDPYDPHAKRPPVDATRLLPRVSPPESPIGKRERQMSQPSSITPSLSASNFPSPTSQADRGREEEARAFAAISEDELRQRRIQRADRPQDFGPVPIERVDLPPDYDQAIEPLSR